MVVPGGGFTALAIFVYPNSGEARNSPKIALRRNG